VFNYCNETSLKAATRTDRKHKCMSGFDLCNLTAGATRYFDKIGADTIHHTVRLKSAFSGMRRASRASNAMQMLRK
jgi:hypothetical protein